MTSIESRRVVLGSKLREVGSLPPERCLVGIVANRITQAVPSLPRNASPRLATALNLFAYTFCKITLCGLHPTLFPPAPHTVFQGALRFQAPTPPARRQTTLQVSPKVPNVCGTIRQKFQVRHGRVRRLYDEFPPSRSLFPASRARGDEEKTADKTRPV